MADGSRAMRALRALPDRVRGDEAPPADFPGGPGDVRRKLVRWSLLLLGPLAVVAVATTLYLQGGRFVSIDNAYVKADMVNVANDVAGMVATVAVRNNQPVSVGEELFRF